MSKFFIAVAIALATMSQAHAWQNHHHYFRGQIFFAPPMYVQPQPIYTNPGQMYYAPQQPMYIDPGSMYYAPQQQPQCIRMEPLGRMFRDMYGNLRREMVPVDICQRHQY